MTALRQVFCSVGLCFAAFAAIGLQSCEKKELPITLPPVIHGVVHGSVDILEDYSRQVWFSVEDTAAVLQNSNHTWDLRFEAAPAGYRVYMNGGRQVFLYKTSATSFGAVTALPGGISEHDWLFDDPSGGPTGSGVGDWQPGGVADAPVYIVRMVNESGNTVYRKIRLLSVDTAEYVLESGALEATQPQTIVLPKHDQYNYVYYSFETGEVNGVEPPKDTWDVLFTRYRYIYRDMDDLPYYVSGVLLNPTAVTAAEDSTTDFASMDLTRAQNYAYLPAADVIGFDWKNYNFTTEKYETNPGKVYLLKTRNNEIWKLHFLSYNLKARGVITFEYARLR